MSKGRWWFDEQGRNNLAGVPGDPTNPPILPDHILVEFLLGSLEARVDFATLLPSMLPLEQLRLNTLADLNPRVRSTNPDPPAVDDQIQGDQVMAALNSGGFRDPNRRRK